MSDPYDVASLDDIGSDRLKMLLHGTQGHGKTTSALSIAEKCKTVVIDLPGEKGIRSIRKVPYTKNVMIIRPTSVDQMDDIFWDLQTDSGKVKGAEAVVLESASSYAGMCMRKILGAPENAMRPIDTKMKGMEIQDWGKLLAFMTDLATFWYGLADATSTNPLHVVMTCQSRRIIDEDTGDTKITLDVPGQGSGPLLANPDYIGYCFVEQVDSDDIEADPKWAYKVRFGPHETIATKIHEDVETNRKLIQQGGSFGGVGKKAQFTIPRFCKAFGIDL
jgi:hypothetical protein